MYAHIPHAQNVDDVIEAIESMRKQEECHYKCGDYLSLYQSDPPRPSSVNHRQELNNNNNNNTALPIDAACRFKMSKWCFQVVDFCKFARETVEIAMSILDRYLQTPHGKVTCMNDRREYQLAAMVSLYTAVKVFEAEAMDPKMIANLSRGVYTEENVEEMEQNILMSIGFRVNVPTSKAFAHHFMELIPQECSCDYVATMNIVNLQLEEAVNHYDFVTVPASTLALAAISNALHCTLLSNNDRRRRQLEINFLQRIISIAQLQQHNSTQFAIVLDQLFAVVAQSPHVIQQQQKLQQQNSKLADNNNENNNENNTTDDCRCKVKSSTTPDSPRGVTFYPQQQQHQQ